MRVRQLTATFKCSVCTLGRGCRSVLRIVAQHVFIEDGQSCYIKRVELAMAARATGGSKQALEGRRGSPILLVGLIISGQICQY